MKIVNIIKDSITECAPFKWGLSLFCHGCNLECSMCKGFNYEKVTDNKNVIGTAIDLIKGNITPFHDCVIFIGGEPTIWGDKLREALRYCHSVGLKTKIFSNGILHKEIEQINSEGLCDSWSIDFKGLNNLESEIGFPTWTYLECFYHTVESINKYKLPLEIRTTFYEGNLRDHDKIVEYVMTEYINPRLNMLPNVYTMYFEQNDVRDLI